MIQVSQNYIEKATAPGRNVRCKIIADDVVYTDVDILSFEFNDVVHPEDMSFGTTCANRFRFELWSRNNIPLSAVIRPFISFADDNDKTDENAEKCTLGEFYIARRYRRRNKYSVTCYDRMYRLDSKFNSPITFPCFASDLLAEIGRQFDFKIGFTPEKDVIESVPRLTTNREIIGYIAGLNGGFAKFSRDGNLQLKKLAVCDFMLNRCQYTDLSVKADVMEVRAVEFIADSETFSEGRGTKLTTYRQKNPFANQEIAERVFNEWKDFKYHGLTVKMRGLPFLESGDMIHVQDDFENKHYLALISDYTLLYDGGLTAQLVSKSKNPVDDYEEPLTQQRLMENLTESMRMRFFNYINERAVAINAAAAPVLSINFNLDATSFIVFNSQFTVSANTECVLTLNYNINNIKIGQTPRMSLSANRPVSMCLYNCFEGLSAGRGTLTVTASVTSGTAIIEPREMISSVSGQHMLQDNGPQRPDINVAQSIGKVEFADIRFGFRRFREHFEQPALRDVLKGSASERLGRIKTAPVNFKLRNLTAVLNTDSALRQVLRIAADKLLLIFTNAVAYDGDGIDLQGFAVTFGIESLEVISAEISSNKLNEMILTTEDLSEFNEIVVKYDSEYGNLLGAASWNPVDSFNYILEL
jgi:hypothetical protein